MFPLICCLAFLLFLSLFSFQGASLNLFKRLNEASNLLDVSVNLFVGGEYRDRTGDLLLARQALSQLS